MKTHYMVLGLVAAGFSSAVFAEDCPTTFKRFNKKAVGAAMTCLTNKVKVLEGLNDRVKALESVSAIPTALPVVTAFENAYIKMQLTGASKNAEGNITLAFNIANKTSSTVYLQSEQNTFTVSDELGGNGGGNQCSGASAAFIGMNKTATNSGTYNSVDYYTAIAPASSIQVTWPDRGTCKYLGNTLNASFGLIRFDPAGNERFGVGFTGIIPNVIQ